MDIAIVVRKKALTSRPQWALIIQTFNGYCVCVVDREFDIAEGQELCPHPSHRGIWLLSGSEKVFPANVHGGMSLDEAELALSRFLAL